MSGPILCGIVFDDERDIIPPDGESGPVAIVRGEKPDASLIVALRNAYANGDLIEREKVEALPEVVTLCGSTRFRDAFESENRRLTLEGRIVISVGLFGHLEGLNLGTDEEPSEVKVMLDDLHKRKIDLSDRIHVVNYGGYIGTSTRSEIEYAEAHGKCVTYMEPMCDATPCRGRGSDEECAECHALDTMGGKRA